MDKLFWDISKLKNWDKNPRGIKAEDFERLKKQIKKLGQYKPLLITQDGTVLGGNMRLKAYQALGVKDIWVSIVIARTDKVKLEYALSDNDRAGYYEEDKLAELMYSLPDFPYSDYKVDLGYQASMDVLMKRFGPDVGEEERGADLGNTVDERLEGWINASVKQIVLIFEHKEFEEVINRLLKVINDFKLKNNTEAVLALLDFYENNRDSKKGN